MSLALEAGDAGSWRDSCTRVGLNLTFNGMFQFDLCLGQVMHLLQVQPELRAVPKEASKAKRRIRRDGASAMNNVPDARRRYANLHGQGILGDSKGFEELFTQHLARMGADPLKIPSRSWSVDGHRLQSPFCRFHTRGLMVVRDLNFMCSICLPEEADAVLIVDSYAVLSDSIPFERFQPVSRRNAKVD